MYQLTYKFCKTTIKQNYQLCVKAVAQIVATTEPTECITKSSRCGKLMQKLIYSTILTG